MIFCAPVIRVTLAAGVGAYFLRDSPSSQKEHTMRVTKFSTIDVVARMAVLGGAFYLSVRIGLGFWVS